MVCSAGLPISNYSCFQEIIRDGWPRVIADSDRCFARLPLRHAICFSLAKAKPGADTESEVRRCTLDLLKATFGNTPSQSVCAAFAELVRRVRATPMRT